MISITKDIERSTDQKMETSSVLFDEKVEHHIAPVIYLAVSDVMTKIKALDLLAQ